MGATRWRQGVVTIQDLTLLREALEEYTPALLIFDPMQSFFGRGVNMNHANETRPILDAISMLCKKFGCTPLYIRHTGKASRNKAIHAALGSIDITGNMRSVLLLATDPERADDRRIIAHAKSNNAPEGRSLAYTFIDKEQFIPTPDGKTVSVNAPLLHWDGFSDFSANDLTSPVIEDAEGKPALEQAQEFLQELLANEAMLSREVQAAAKHAGIAWATIRRAKVLLAVGTRKRSGEGKDSLWAWYLPERPSSCSYPTHISDEQVEQVVEPI